MYLLIFLLFPLIELWLLIKVGSIYGALTSIGLVLATAVIGLLLVQLQWQKLRLNLQSHLRQGNFNPNLIHQGAALGFAGILLFLPGLITDTLGLLLIFPPSRHFILQRLAKQTASYSFYSNRQQSAQSFYSARSDAFSSANELHQGEVLEGEFVRKDNETMTKK